MKAMLKSVYKRDGVHLGTTSGLYVDQAQAIDRAVDMLMSCSGRPQVDELHCQLGEGEHSSSSRTGLGLFDRAADRSVGIMSGNVSSNVQYSSFIRARGDVEVNGHQFPPGHLQQLDMDMMRSIAARLGDMPRAQLRVMSRLIEGAPPDRGAVIYFFFHKPNPNESRFINHGAILTDHEHNLVDSWVSGESPKSQRVMDIALAVTTHQIHEPSTLFRIRGGAVVEADPRVMDRYAAIVGAPLVMGTPTMSSQDTIQPAAEGSEDGGDSPHDDQSTPSPRA